MAKKKKAQPTRRFEERLVLNQWMLGLFEVEKIDVLCDFLRDPVLETFDEDGVSGFYRQLVHQLFGRKELPPDVLLGYDENIVRHWRAITEKRSHAGRPMMPKYFQYLALLFTEIYLDRYFRSPEKLLSDLNEHVDSFNKVVSKADWIGHFTPDELRKVAYWQATGSGKTLLMHVNILQYQHYLKHFGRERELNRIILLTPNEGLSRQHLGEFKLSGLRADLFSKDAGSLYAGRAIEIIDIHKLKDEMGDKTVAVEAFEGNNLVLVDEGHLGASGTVWMSKRKSLTEQGFSFEYSATFGQAIKSKPDLVQEYARSILFDYSYKYFYRDGYGKDYLILNLADDSQDEIRQTYLTASLLVFYQQMRLFQDRRTQLKPFLLERPLLVFVASTVTKKLSKREASDIIEVLLFLSSFVRDRDQVIRRIEALLKGHAGLTNSRGRELFANAFPYLIKTGRSATEIYEDLLRTVFNAPSGGLLHVELLKGAEGEIALRLGENDAFGVINVGDAKTLVKLCEKYEPRLFTSEREFSGSLFQALESSTANVLIGSKKFTEGWNSWRVSTMGLMNVGKSEGSEIIQLFGRGVRLKGYDFSLKRSGRLEGYVLPHKQNPEFIRLVETLNVFGVRANYMQEFRQYLEDEGLPDNEEQEELILPVIRTKYSGKLKTIGLKAGLNFKKNGTKPTLGEVPDALINQPLVLDWYPKIEARRSPGIKESGDTVEKQEGKLTASHLAFLDMDALYFEVERFKAERAWYNLNLPRSAIEDLLGRTDWYQLKIPTGLLAFSSFGRVRLWQEIAATLLKKYCERYYTYSRQKWEAPYLEYRDLTANDPNFINEYRLLVNRSEESIIETIKGLQKAISEGKLKDVTLGSFRSICFNRHLYQPLISFVGEVVEVRPVALNEGESDFVLELRKYYDQHSEFFQEKELYLLRNQSRGRGIGFFEAGNFHPDFILWLLDGTRQFVTFVDPKGLRNLEGPDDRKIRFYRTIKDLQAQLGNPDIILNSFILSTTMHSSVKWWGLSETDFEERHVLFKDATNSYRLERLFQRLEYPKGPESSRVNMDTEQYLTT